MAVFPSWREFPVLYEESRRRWAFPQSRLSNWTAIIMPYPTADSFWNDAATNARAFFRSAAHPITGLLPVRSTFAGAPVPGSDTFRPEGYRAQLNMVLDTIWFRADPWQVEESDRLVRFFLARGLRTYGSSYSLDGSTTIETTHDASLVAVNGMSALTATGSGFAGAAGFERSIPGVLTSCMAAGVTPP